ncbi:MAG: polysaccharide deacetylase family protein [Bacteroidetes bacterium]|jgi:peptidoglycan/xylan/chitin deacetylase (PgdA/CDA1 family)|nr:polysaccharide deacetylase family protein [Bacteroidota bacterium]
MIAAKTPGIVKKLYYSLYWNLSRQNQGIYLTFDDGPTPEITEKTLDLLEKYGAKATFFCIGRNVERYPDIYQQILNYGHVTGNHTYSHLKGWQTSNDEYFKDIELAKMFIPSNLFRPPYGKIRRSQLKYLRNEYKIIMWDVMSYDFSQKVTNDQCRNFVIKHTKPGSIVVFHDSVKAADNMLFALEHLLEYFTDKGFAFKAIPILQRY